MKTNPFIHFRVGSVLFALNQPELAFPYFVEADKRLESAEANKWLAEKDVARVVIKDRLAVQHYLRADRKLQSLIRMGITGVEQAELRNDFLEAARRANANRAALGLVDAKVTGSWKDFDLRRQRRSNVTILIDSAISFVDCGGSEAALKEHGIEIRESEALVETLDSRDDTPRDRVMFLDTVRNFYRFTGQDGKERATAETIIALFNENPSLHKAFYSVPWYAEVMLAGAFKSLS